MVLIDSRQWIEYRKIKVFEIIKKKNFRIRQLINQKEIQFIYQAMK